jgi:RNA 3'-terminal phosphate cyclase (ATP)
VLLVDGSLGEGGGQILRTALGLSLVTGTPFTIERIRAGRKTPGLLRQHLTAVEAATRVGDAEVEGATIGSQRVVFRPRQVRPGRHAFAVGTAGSATLVLQTVLPALLTAAEPSTIELEGGTHNPWAPPFDFLVRTFLPLIGRMGPCVTAELERCGFYPAGGGRFTVRIEPVAALAAIDLPERGEVRSIVARATVAGLPASIATRELAVVRERLGLERVDARIVEEKRSHGPGNVVTIDVESEHVTEVFTGFGERGVRAEAVADRVAREVARYLHARVPVGEHLADQLLIPLALAGGGAFTTHELSAHARTNVESVRAFLGRPFEIEPAGTGTVRVAVRGEPPTTCDADG